MSDATTRGKKNAPSTVQSPQRRGILQALGALGIAAAAPAGAADMSGMMGMQGMGAMPGMGMGRQPTSAPRAGVFSRALWVPPELRGQQQDGVLHYALRMGAGSSMLAVGLLTPTWGYNGAVLGPTLRVPRGKAVRIDLHNALDQSTTTHWHGAHVPGDMDGGPQSIIAPGERRRVEFTLQQPAGTLWYHPHPDTRTGPHVYAGLGGMLLVDDPADGYLGLPQTYGVDDMPLILQDRRLAADGRLLYMTDMMDRMGMKGDRFLVNGREQPYWNAPAQWVRLRVLNAANARLFNLAFADGRAFHVIATDAGLLPRPVAVHSLLLAPSERVEILVDLRREQGKRLVLRSDSGAVVPGLSSMPMDADAFDHHGFDLLELRVGTPAGTGGQLPARMVDLPVLKADAPVRRFTLQGMSGNMMGGMGGMGGMRSAKDSGPGGMSLGVGGEKLFSINHHHMEMTRIDQRLRLGATEIWEVVNQGHMAHPFHYHSTSFQILSRNGSTPPAHEAGWKDTVLVRHGETVRLIARFDQPAGDAHPFMFHCHILEHEDNGMMGQFTVA
ncbi:multicopper oxidase family protein [Thiomonas bhubaneswarensis]|uniref:Multicopper oxidase CueO n=1 Tax=Thiomonas bhubaneswarensis TaxID=339866 RepID=A0A0K6HZF0_9BURK|nr:multicopper oxidase domain-containing protein [Thiomonas bhubaneswarensis]CUA96188.1 cell division protein SufI [Thiomonas bhubaneswarensis]